MKMTRLAASLTGLLFMAVPLIGATAPADTARAISLAPESRLWVEGTSTVQAYRCETGALRASIEANDVPATLGELGAAVQRVDLRVPVSTLECGNRTMNGHMLNALKSDAHPDVRFRVTRHSVAANGDTRLEGRLSIGGTERPVTINATARDAGNGQFRLQGETRLVMTEFDITPPRLMMGTMRVHDPVVVGFDLVLQP